MPISIPVLQRASPGFAAMVGSLFGSKRPPPNPSGGTAAADPASRPRPSVVAARRADALSREPRCPPTGAQAPTTSSP